MHSLQTLGTFVPAVFTIPENPIRAAMGLSEIVDGIYYAPTNGVIEDILARRALAEELAKNPVGLSGCGPSTCPCRVGFCGPGMGQLGATVDEVLKSVTSGGWQTWALVAGGIGALILFTGGGGSQRRSELAAARAQYKAEVAKIRASRPRRYQKLI